VEAGFLNTPDEPSTMPGATPTKMKRAEFLPQGVHIVGGRTEN